MRSSKVLIPQLAIRNLVHTNPTSARKKMLTKDKKDVCIIGAGPTGILAIATLKDCCNVSCFERANEIGGQWARGTDDFTRHHYGSRHSRFIFTQIWV